MSEDLLQLHLRDLPYFRALLRAVEARLMQKLVLPPPVLDLGCGDGHFAQLTYPEGLDLGMDPGRSPLVEARKRQVYRMLLQADGARMPFASATFGSAISNSVLEHIPALEAVLREVGRVLQPGALFAFTVPNPGYREELSIASWLHRIGFHSLGRRYQEWFLWVTRTYNLFDRGGWANRLHAAGFEIIEACDYFSVDALRQLEWGHYFGVPSLFSRLISGRWILAPYRWNLLLTDRLVRPYFEEQVDQGTYSFYLAQRSRAQSSI